jgi:hypothetical protein
VFQDGWWLRGDTQLAQPELAPDGDGEPPHGGMQMHVLVGVQVIEGETGRGESLKLRTDLSCKLPADARAKKVIGAEAKLIRRKLTACVDEVWDE